MVIGCGALGNEVLKNLTLLGVGTLTIIDFDTVEATNLTRSVLFRRQDVGRPKVEVARERLRDINPGLKVNALCADIIHDVGLGLIHDADMLVSCVDSRWARYIINRHCMRMGKHWVDGGISTSEATARIFGGDNCYACALGTEGQRELARRMPCSNTIRRSEAAGHAPTNILTAAVAAAVMAQEVAKLLCGTPSELQRHLFAYDADTVTGRRISFAAYDDDCTEHELWTNIEHSDITTHHTVAEALSLIGDTDPAIRLREDVFVDYIYRRTDDSRYAVMCPGRYVAERIDDNATLRGTPLSAFYQNEYNVLDLRFPYKDLTLSECGIPPHDILDCGGRYLRIGE